VSKFRINKSGLRDAALEVGVPASPLYHDQGLQLPSMARTTFAGVSAFKLLMSLRPSFWQTYVLKQWVTHH
jgi:hypothetical protein